jgi:hypothetical protein
MSEKDEIIEYTDFAYVTFVYARLLPSQTYDLQELFCNIWNYYQLPFHYSVLTLDSRVEKWTIMNLDSAKPYLVLTFTVFSHTGKIFIPETTDYCFGIEISSRKNEVVNPLVIDHAEDMNDELFWAKRVSQRFHESGYADSHQKFIDERYNFLDTMQNPFTEFE